MADQLKFTSEGVPKNWKGKDWQAYKFAMQMVFREAELMEIVDGTITKETLSDAESKEKFDKKQTKIMRLIGMSVPSEILHQIRDKMTGTEMWEALCDLLENKVNKTVKAHTIRRLRDEHWTVKFSPGGNMNLHLSKMFNIRTELQTLQYAVDDIDMVEMMLESLPAQAEFESLKSSIRYSADTTMFTPTKVRELIRAAAARQVEFRGKGQRGGPRVGSNGGASGVNGTKGRADNQHEEKSSDSKKKKLKKCFICGSTAHLRAACPDRTDKSSGDGANATEQKHKPRGNVTIRQEVRESPSPDSDNGGSSVEMAALDQMILDAGVEVDIRDPEPESPGDVDAQEANSAEADDAVGDSNGWWFFDTAANAHVTGNLLDFEVFTEDTSQSQSVHGVAPALASRIAGVGTVALVTEVDGERGVVYLNDVVYVPGAEHGLLSPGLAAEQGFDFDYEHDTLNFRVKYEGRTVVVSSPCEATWGFFVTHPVNEGLELPRDRTMCNCTAIDGVASLALWHERLGHICPQYLKAMADKGLVKGLMLTRREQQDPCDACHLGKQKKTSHAKKLNRGLKAPNQAMYVDLLIPSQGNGTRFEAVLVIMDGYSRFVTVHMLNSKSSKVINQHIKENILWAERQAGRSKDGAERVKYRVRQVWTDKGGEFMNSAMKKWYRAHGIEHIRVGPKRSQLNLCERTHQSLVGMMKAMMLDSGFPTSLWPEAQKNAVYLKNRVFNKGHGGVPYEKMFGVKPDVHHIRKFGALAYVYVPVTPGRRKFSDNAKVGFLCGGCCGV